MASAGAALACAAPVISTLRRRATTSSITVPAAASDTAAAASTSLAPQPAPHGSFSAAAAAYSPYALTWLVLSCRRRSL